MKMTKQTVKLLNKNVLKTAYFACMGVAGLSLTQTALAGGRVVGGAGGILPLELVMPQEITHEHLLVLGNVLPRPFKIGETRGLLGRTRNHYAHRLGLTRKFKQVVNDGKISYEQEGIILEGTDGRRHHAPIALQPLQNTGVIDILRETPLNCRMELLPRLNDIAYRGDGHSLYEPQSRTIVTWRHLDDPRYAETFLSLIDILRPTFYGLTLTQVDTENCKLVSVGQFRELDFVRKFDGQPVAKNTLDAFQPLIDQQALTLNLRISSHWTEIAKLSYFSLCNLSDRYSHYYGGGYAPHDACDGVIGWADDNYYRHTAAIEVESLRTVYSPVIEPVEETIRALSQVLDEAMSCTPETIGRVMTVLESHRSNMYSNRFKAAGVILNAAEFMTNAEESGIRAITQYIGALRIHCEQAAVGLTGSTPAATPRASDRQATAALPTDLQQWFTQELENN